MPIQHRIRNDTAATADKHCDTAADDVDLWLDPMLTAVSLQNDLHAVFEINVCLLTTVSIYGTRKMTDVNMIKRPSLLHSIREPTSCLNGIETTYIFWIKCHGREVGHFRAMMEN